MAYKRKQSDAKMVTNMIKNQGKKFISYQEGAALYSLGLHSFQQLAKDAKATYRVKGRVLVNIEKVDEFLEALCEE